MGTYYYVVNYDKKEFLHPHRFGDGLKLMEFAFSSIGVLTGLSLLLVRGSSDILDPSAYGELVVGRWTGDRISIVVGDYDRDFGDIAYEQDGWVNISAAVVEAMRRGKSYLRDALDASSGRFGIGKKDSQAYDAWLSRALLQKSDG